MNTHTPKFFFFTFSHMYEREKGRGMVSKKSININNLCTEIELNCNFKRKKIHI